MSTTIDYRREAFYFDKPYPGQTYTDRQILVLTEMGASNCYDMNNRRARDWQILAFNSAYSVYREVAEHAGTASGGMLAMNRMSDRMCGDYAGAIFKVIRAYDKVIKAATPIEKVFDCFKIFADLQICGEMEAQDAGQLAEFLKLHSLTPRYEQYYGEQIQRAGLCINDAATLAAVYSLRGKKGLCIVYRITKKGELKTAGRL